MPTFTAETPPIPTTITSRDFNQDVSRAKRAADAGPVVITDRGKPAYVLLRHEDYCRLADTRPNLSQRLRMPDGDDIEFDPPRADFGFKPAEFD